MAAIICRVLFVEPCQALGRFFRQACACCESCCGYFCDSLSNLCRNICNLIDKPFFCCLLISVLLNISVIIWCIDGLLTNDCDNGDNEIMAFLAILIYFGISNFIFSIYVFIEMNTDEMQRYYSNDGTLIPNEPGEQNNQKFGNKVYQFFHYNKYFAIYICIVLIPMIVILIMTMTYDNSDCNNNNNITFESLYGSAILLFVFIGVSSMVLFCYMGLDVAIQWSKNPCCWCIICLWPCLICGLCANRIVGRERDGATAKINQHNKPTRGQQV